ncbi:hypothetical protein [Escherichia coli]|nr:hypothetical protein [Escherichia coli]
MKNNPQVMKEIRKGLLHNASPVVASLAMTEIRQIKIGKDDKY